MAIAVTCPSCHARFNVSEKFAGKKGPCPKCKATITIPSLEQQVKIHEREHEGARGASGQLVLKPIERSKVAFKPLIIAAGLAPVFIVMAGAWYLGTQRTAENEVSYALVALGAAILGPPLAIGGYTFLRNDELEPHRGQALLLRGLICGLLYAALWGVYTAVPREYRTLVAAQPQTSPGQPQADQETPVEPDMFSAAVVLAAFFAAGAGVAFASLDLDFASGFFHYLLYFLVSIACRWLLGWTIV